MSRARSPMSSVSMLDLLTDQYLTASCLGLRAVYRFDHVLARGGVPEHQSRPDFHHVVEWGGVPEGQSAVPAETVDHDEHLDPGVIMQRLHQLIQGVRAQL